MQNWEQPAETRRKIAEQEENASSGPSRLRAIVQSAQAQAWVVR